ncbi:MAG: VanZ family protein [Firmicutes bacterium]|nr:VanZ family protein [Bacillota bacterium]
MPGRSDSTGYQKARELTVFYGLLTLAYMGAIYHFSSLPGSRISLPAPDYVMHALEYLGLGGLLGITIRSAGRMRDSLQNPPGIKSNARGSSFRVCVSLPVSIGFAYALSDEFHQFFVPGRNASISDLAADLFGIVLAQIFLKLSYDFRPHGQM